MKILLILPGILLSLLVSGCVTSNYNQRHRAVSSVAVEKVWAQDSKHIILEGKPAGTGDAETIRLVLSPETCARIESRPATMSLENYLAADFTSLSASPIDRIPADYRLISTQRIVVRNSRFIGNPMNYFWTVPCDIITAPIQAVIVAGFLLLLHTSPNPF